MEIAFLQQQGEVLTQRRIHRISIKIIPQMPVAILSGRSPRRRARPFSQAAAAAAAIGREMSTPGEEGHPRSGAGIDPDRPAIYRERPPAAPRLAAGVIRRRPSGARLPLPKNLRGAARFWLVMILLLVVAPFLGLGAAGGSGSYVGEINDAARKVFEHAHSAGLTGVTGR
jgi:hypothetical protein